MNASIQLSIGDSKVYPSELLSVQEQTTIVSKHNTESFNHFHIVKYTLGRTITIRTETIWLSQSDSLKFSSFALSDQ